MVDPTYRGYLYTSDDISAFNVSDQVECGAATIQADPGYVQGGAGDTGDNQSLLGRPAAMPRNQPSSLDIQPWAIASMIDHLLCSHLPIALAHSAGGPVGLYAVRAASMRQQGGTGDTGSGTVPPAPGGALPTQGQPFPWEGTSPGGGSDEATGYVNTQTGNRMTVMPLTGWDTPGGLGIGLTLYHNSQDNLDIGWGMNWRSSYDWRAVYAGIYGSSKTPKLVISYPDGRRIVFTRTSGSINRYYPPTGFYDIVFRSPTGWLLRRPDQTLYTFDLKGYLNSIADRYGNVVTVNHDAYGGLTSVVDQNGKSLTFTSNSNGYHGAYTPYEWYTSVTAPVGTFTINTRTQKYNGGMNVLDSVLWPQLGSNGAIGEYFGYDIRAEIVGETAVDSNLYKFAYDSNSRLSSFSYNVPFYTNPITQAGGGSNLSYSYSYGSTSTSLNDPYGNKETDNYDGGTVVSHVDQAGYSQSYNWDINYNLTQLKDERGFTSNFTYDPFGNLASSQDPIQWAAGKSQKYTYNSYNDILTSTDCRGAVTTYTRNAGPGTLASVKDGLGNILESYTWNANGTLNSASTEGGTTSLAYNAQWYPSSITTPDQTYSISYGSNPGLISSVSDSLGRTTTVGRDNWSRAISVTRSDNSSASVGLDNMGRVVSSTDFLNQTSSVVYDGAGRPVSSQNANHDTEHYYWFDMDRLAGVSDGNNHLKSYAYTVRGEEKGFSMADTSYEQYQHDGAGNVTTRGSALGNMGQYAYNTAENLTGITYPSGPGVSLTYDYDGRTTSETDAAGTNSWTYDLGDRLTNFVSPQGSIAYAYDQWGRTTQLNEGDGVKIQYGYSGPRLAFETKLPENETTTWTYDGIGRLSKQTYANGATEGFDYDGLDRLASITHQNSSGGNILTENYSYDANSNLSSKTSNGVVSSYTYDAVGQLLSETSPGYAGAYTYDHNGNRATRTVNGTTETYNYDSGDKLLSVVVGSNTEKSYLYDAAGRTVQVVSAAGTTNLSYDYEDRIIGISTPGHNDAMTYNAFDARVSKTDSSGTKTYLRDGEDPVDDVLSDGTSVYTPGISSHSSTGSRFEHEDYLGTNRFETDSSQNVQGSRTYDAFGNPTSTTGSPQGPFGFAGNWGYQEDPDTGLKLLGHRYYDPSTGRFLTRDAMKIGSNWNSYCGNNGTGSVDPFGWDPLNANEKSKVQSEIDLLRNDGQTAAADRLQKQLDDGKITYGGRSPRTSQGVTMAITNRDGSVILYDAFLALGGMLEQAAVLLHESVHIYQDRFGTILYNIHYRGSPTREYEAYSAEIEFMRWCIAHHKIRSDDRHRFMLFYIGQYQERRLCGS